MTPDVSAIGAALIALILIVGAALADRPSSEDPTVTPESIKGDLIRLMEISRRAGVDFDAALSSAQAEDYRAQESTDA